MKQHATELLKCMFGPDSIFRNGQLEAIMGAVNGKRVLVVQKTGWGKSIVYFIATKMRREEGRGITLLISPLLALMRNQIESANKLGLYARTINSSNADEWDEIKQELFEDQCDLLLLSPERLADEDFKSKILSKLKIGMFVVDEAHCISDWGHDFRPDYQRIVSIVANLPPNVPVLATTATANNRVIQDVQEQLGGLQVQRGPLLRESLHIQVIKLGGQEERLAWLDENIERMPGTGIIYCLTVASCEKVVKWLKDRGHNVEAYHSQLKSSEQDSSELRIEREKCLMKNKVKALVATVALGMGFDKPDVGFVVHYQRPGNLIAYYQQIGRAGRSLKNAYAILLSGREDDEIQEYFIQSAFPTEIEMTEVLNHIEGSECGLGLYEILSAVNLKQGKVKQILKFLLLQNAIFRNEKSKYIRTVRSWKANKEKSKKITERRWDELEKMKKFVDTNSCYLRYVADALDDPYAQDCGKCANCLKKDFFDGQVRQDTVLEAVKFLKGDYLPIEVRKRWPAGWKFEKGKISDTLLTEEGRVLCAYGDAGWGKCIREDKYNVGRFRNELVEAAVSLIRKWNIVRNLEWIVCVPSLRHPRLVPDFAARVAAELKLPFHPCILKTKETSPQKTMQNTSLQASNVYDCFAIKGKCPSGDVLLIDDLVDSRWTFTICGKLLREKGSGAVYPFALASTAGGDKGDG
ncbi:MAG: RecQ family ATP-dependent DNA helicase [Anaeromusa sp.]|uniref:RecQ family ATP-dependent DNA helicase n=1 Tax=Anaeromusa sp. TaxID=1872520 RepID=UPI0026173ADA|nr:RecQ family ATP-dependent DNA helicase [Anaeromusa sp.]MDD3157334.1 RecQ family ATP-dependent DNA helicase [Anaeromusa sp.]MEA4834666.1 RecQ family ATP-dependent DNA helicase [Anaeromusa sp.]